MKAYKDGTLTVLTIPNQPSYESMYDIFKRRGSQSNWFKSSEPLMYSPFGPRYSINGNRIVYFDWEFNYLIMSVTGPSLFDVRFKGQRIAYEISLQEAGSFYSTGGAYMNAKHYLDSVYFLGSSASSLMHGVDCPQHAIYL